VICTVTEEDLYAIVRVNYTSTYRILINNQVASRYLLNPYITLDVNDDVFQQIQDETVHHPELISTQIQRKLSNLLMFFMNFIEIFPSVK